MKHIFRAKIYKVGINPCVKVPFRITDRMKPVRGYIPVKGKIGNYPFQQTLVPVKDDNHRLYVNGLMLKGAGVRLGHTVEFKIEQDFSSRQNAHPMPLALRKKLTEHNLHAAFKKLIPSRQKEILRYLNNLKTEESLKRNIDKVTEMLASGR